MTEPTGIAYLALDIETTGLDPEKDQILEIAWRAINGDLEEIPDETFTRVFTLTNGGLNRLTQAPEVVRVMHSASGLLGDVLGSRETLDPVISILNTTLMRLHRTYERVHLLGMSVHFDAEFLKHNKFEWLFNDKNGIHHRMYDLSSVKLALAQAGVEWPVAPKGNHRALADVREAVAQARLFQNLLIVGLS